MSIKTICITRKEYLKGREIFEKAKGFRFVPVGRNEFELSAAIKKHSAFGAVVGVDAYDGLLYESFERGGVVARFGVGYDGIDIKKATDNGVLVVNTPGVLDNSVAEHTVGLICALARNIPQEAFSFKGGLWIPRQGCELFDKTLLVIGCGKIGCLAARIAAFGFGMHTLGFDVSDLDSSQIKDSFGLHLVADLGDAVSQADFVTMHVPAIPSTRHLVNGDFLSRMKSSAYLINTSRGPIVDEIALFEALASGEIAGAALDVFENEPYQPVKNNRDLRTLDNIVLTPHIGSSTHEACRRMAERVVYNLRGAESKAYTQMDIVNTEVLEKRVVQNEVSHSF